MVMAKIIQMKHKLLGVNKTGFYGFSWTTLFFGFFPALFRGDFLTFIGGFFVVIILGFMTLGVGSLIAMLVWAFFYNDYYTKKLLECGYEFAGTTEENIQAAKVLKIQIQNAAEYKNEEKAYLTINIASKFSPNERSIDNDAYKLHLIEKYKITKNEVLNQFVLSSKIYETIGDVLNAAHNIEMQESMAAEEKLRTSTEKISEKISALSDQAKSYLEVILRNGYKLEETLIKNNSLIWVFQAKSNGSRFEINSIEELRSLAGNFK